LFLVNPLTKACTTVLAPETRGIVFCGYAHPTTRPDPASRGRQQRVAQDRHPPPS
jgi:hypothetical protein